jgi:putrescine importer
MTLVLWVNLSAESRNYGLIWFVLGIVVLLWITRLLRRPLTMKME